MISVVIPAHDEGNVIRRCLESMTDGAHPGELEILVVCNGCSDDTAEIARSFGKPVRVLETDIPSKNNALNMSNEAAGSFPRSFVDADIVLPLESIRKVADVLRGGKIMAAAPRIRVDLSSRGWPIRACYGVWMRTPYVNENMLGCGVYAISDAGRDRFDRFPGHHRRRLLHPPALQRRRKDLGGRCLVPDDAARDAAQLDPDQRTPHGRGLGDGRAPPGSHPNRGTAAARGPAPAGATAATLARYGGLRLRQARHEYHLRLEELQGRHKEWNRDDTSR